MDSMRQVLERTYNGTDFYIALGCFLDEFYRSEKNIRESMLEQPPEGRGAEVRHEELCYAAATAHKLANDYGLSVPPWVFEKRYYMDDPFFGCRAKGNLRLLFMYKSPTEFKHRNLFVDENVLMRV